MWWWALIALALSGCGRLNFDGVDADGGVNADASEVPAVLGESCSSRACAPDLACVRDYCNCTVEVKGDEDQTCGLRADGTVWCWGKNENGELGDGTVGGESLQPNPVVMLSGVQGHDLGAFHACARNQAGQVYCWGQFASEPEKPVPELVSGIPPVAEIASGGFHTCLRTTAGGVWCMGLNDDAQIGNGTVGGFVSEPQEIAVSGAVSLAAGGFHTCAALDSGTVACWGLNDHGQIGDDTTGNVRSEPAAVANLDDVVQVTAGDWSTCARRRDGSVWCWGINDFGQVGTGATGADQLVPRHLDELGGMVDVFSGDDQSCAFDAEGALYCWGSNDEGQLGIGGGGGIHPPTRVDSVGPVVDVAIGRRHTCAFTRDGAMSCWGRNLEGQLGTGTGDSAADPTPSLFSCPQ